MDEWIAAAALATLTLAKEALDAMGMRKWPGTAQGINKRALLNGWQGRQNGSSQAWEYHAPSLPRPIREALMDQASKSLPVVISEPINTAMTVVIGNTTHLSNWQREIMDARAPILKHVDALAMLGSWRQGALTVVRQSQDGTLPEDLAQLLPIANARSGVKGSRSKGERTVSLRSLQRWFSDREKAGGKASALAPKEASSVLSIPVWAPALCALHNRPQKPSLQATIKALAKPEALPPGVVPPTYEQAKRFLRKMDAVDRQRGRMGARELKSIRPFRARDTSELWPLDVVQADGHCFDAEVEHPRHHRPFRPEITSAIDLATRLIVGWSASLSETSLGVADALIYLAMRWGVPAIWYVDNGSGFNSSFMEAGVTGLLGRLGTTKLNRLPYNSQAGGYIERVHQTVWVAGAKTLPTYIGDPMDPEAKQKVFKITRADIKKFGRSRTLMTWGEFIIWAQAQVDNYNSQPHSGLPKVADPVTGKSRHQTPLEAWQAARAEGWEPIRISEDEAADLTRPYETRKVRRGVVEVLGGKYFHRDLAGYHDEEVLVGFDIHDASRVWVRDTEGRLICIAGFEANKGSVVPMSYQEKAWDIRAKGREKRAMAVVNEIRAERKGLSAIDITADPISPETAEVMARLTAPEPVPPPAPAPTAIPATPEDRFERWTEIDSRLAAGLEVQDGERLWWERYQQSKEYLGQKATRQAQELPAHAG